MSASERLPCYCNPSKYKVLKIKESWLRVGREAHLEITVKCESCGVVDTVSFASLSYRTVMLFSSLLLMLKSES